MRRHWLWPKGARKLHAFEDGAGISACRYHHANDTEPAMREWPRCTRCERALAEDRDDG